MCEFECSQVDALMSRLAAAESEIKRAEALAVAAAAARAAVATMAAEMLKQKQVPVCGNLRSQARDTRACASPWNHAFAFIASG